MSISCGVRRIFWLIDVELLDSDFRSISPESSRTTAATIAATTSAKVAGDSHLALLGRNGDMKSIQRGGVEQSG